MQKNVKNHARSVVGFAALLIFGAGHVVGQTSYYSNDPNNLTSQYPAAAYQEVPEQGNSWHGASVNPYSPTYTVPTFTTPTYTEPASEPSVYVANREMMPVSPTAPGATSNSTASEPASKPENKFTAYFKNLFKGSKKDEQTQTLPQANVPPHQTSQSVAITPPGRTEYAAPVVPQSGGAQQVVHTEEKISSEGTKTGSEENKSFFSSLWPSSSSSKSKSKKDEEVDDGLDFVEMIDRERSFSEKDYVESAVRSKKATAKDQYGRGMQYEAQGDFASAKREYFGFIRANKKQTQNGTLAAPYHRLALIAWKQQDPDKADVYFRYSLRYAQGGNIPVISGDYSMFLIERKKTDQAETVLRSALLHFPQDKRLLFSLGQCVARQDKTVEAMRYLTEATDEDRAYQEIALIYQQRGEYTLAQNMMRKRDLYLAERNAKSHQQQYFVQNRVAVPVQPGPPPVIQNPRGMIGQASLVHPMPFPMPEDWNGPTAMSQTTGTAGGAANAANATPEPKSPGNTADRSKSQNGFPPVSKVYHYPKGSPTPVYHQYVGEQYPQTVQGGQGPSGPYYMMSTVPQNPVETQTQGPSAVGQVPQYVPVM